MPTSGFSTGARIAAGAVHVYTATGAVLALLMVHLAYRGDIEAVLWLFLASMFVDGTDGMLARRFRVKEVMPGFDGSLLDNIVDYMTYTLAPMALLWANGYLPDGVWGGVVASLPVAASCYQFCRSDAKTDDHFFLGFPSYWNIVAFYAVVGGFGTTATVIALLVCTALVFVPIKYLYPSRTETLWYANMTFAGLWMVAYAVVVAEMPNPSDWLVLVSLAYPVYYVVLSLYLTFSPTSHRRLPRTPEPVPSHGA